MRVTYLRALTGRRCDALRGFTYLELVVEAESHRFGRFPARLNGSADVVVLVEGFGALDALLAENIALQHQTTNRCRTRQRTTATGRT